MTKQETFGIKPGLRVLVTAGAAGIGRVVADAFAGVGAKIHVCDVVPAVLDACKKDHPDWGVTLCDVSKPDQVEKLFADVKKNLGGLDVLVNNAGIGGPTGGVDKIKVEDWMQTIDINLNGQFLCAHHAVPLLRQNAQDSSIICISSVAGRLGYALRTPYAATKWAIVGFMKSLAQELGPEGIRCNAILPGIVEGPRMTNVIKNRAAATNVSYEDMEKQYLNKISLRRMVSPQDVANMALYLCSPLGRNVTGQPISVCGDVVSL
jgi:NAD(P)-dependent dehydrogenase (short-subunit alcohol dehydrogenase family)